MAAEEPQPQSIQARIAALNVGHVGRAPITATATKWDEEGSERPSLDQRRNTASLPTTSPRLSNGVGNEPIGPKQNGVLPPSTITRTGQREAPRPAPPPRLPPRRDSTKPSPALPPRRPSEQVQRRGSNESVSSTFSALSSVSHLSNGTNRHEVKAQSTDSGRVKAPVYDPSTLPVLPPKRSSTTDSEKARTRLTSRRTPSQQTIPEIHTQSEVSPSVPPRPPARQASSTSTARKLPPIDQPSIPGRRGMPQGFTKTNDGPSSDDPTHSRLPPPLPDHPSTKSRTPPPVPKSTRPDLSSIMSTKPKPQASPSSQPTSTPSSTSCLFCRDFSLPDTHASKFPRQSVPSLDWLAHQLTSPFPSPTDKARSIFTWLHHNISYDVDAFFNNRLQPSTPASTLSTGLAVCEGYAGLFTALALKAGLESITVSGHGKGFGFSTLQPGESIPGEFSTHAWNAVRIDGGEWKLIDCCWGAGHVQGKGMPYVPKFSPECFTMSNETFGWKHYPMSDKSLWFFGGRAGQGGGMDWRTYYLGPNPDAGPPVQTYNILSEEGISEQSLQPSSLHIHIPSSSQNPIRFSFSLLCPHFTPQTHGPGPPYVYVLLIHGPSGSKDEYIPLEVSSDEKVWWVDVERGQLGVRGQSVGLYVVSSVQGEGEVRGMGVRGYRERKGRRGMGFGGVARWELV